MKEEFHGNGLSGTAWKGKLLYGWNTLTASVWLPSLSELVGTTGAEYPNGCYKSAMQGLNIATWGCVDKQGGAQWAYFTQYNAQGGGEAIWEASNHQRAWLRSCTVDTSQHAWRSTDAQRFDYSAATNSHTVHPAVLGGTSFLFMVKGQVQRLYLSL